MTFIKGHPVRNSGRTRFKKGRIISEEHKGKLRQICVERNKRNNPVWDPEVRKKISKTLIGHKQSQLTKSKRSLAQLGEKGSNWQGGKTQGQKLRMTAKYREWRRRVFERDNYTCQRCGKRGGKLEAHHKKQFSKFPELRFAIDNGETVHKICHKKIKIQRK